MVVWRRVPSERNNAMDDHSMRRYIAVLVGGAALIVAACSEPVSSPPSAQSRQWVPTLSPHVTAQPANMWAIEQAGTYTFTLNPEGGHADIGVYNLEYDAD